MPTAKAYQEPEGSVVHYYNSDTGRFIGNKIHSQLKRYGGARTEGFQLLASNLAWGSLCSRFPVLAVCVAGPGMCLSKGTILTSEESDVRRALYFRLLSAKLIGLDPEAGPATGEFRTMLLPGPTGLYTGKGSLRFQDTDMNLIGVDIARLRKLRLQALDHDFEPSFANMGKVKLQLSPFVNQEDRMHLDEPCAPRLLAGQDHESDPGGAEASDSMVESSAPVDTQPASRPTILTETASNCSSEVR